MQGRRRRIRLSAYAVAAALLLCALALGSTAVLAHGHLRDAQVAVGQLRSSLADQRAPATEVDRHLRVVQREASRARSLTSGPRRPRSTGTCASSSARPAAPGR